MTVRLFALIAGIVYVLAGLLGFFPGVVEQAATADGYDLLLGIFAVNILHNLVHLALGLWGVVAYREGSAARGYSRSLAVILGVLTVMGLIPGLSTVFGLMPVFGHDIWLHAVTALLAAYFAWGAPADDPRSATAGMSTDHR